MFRNTVVAAGVTLFTATGIAFAQSSTTAISQQQQQTKVTSDTRSTSELQELQGAAQRLRESIQVMAKMSPGPQRDQAIRSAHEALFDANQSMLRLPVEYRGSAFTWSPSRSGQTRMSGQTEQHAMQMLQKASERLYSAIHAMARESTGDKRAGAIKEANEALIETHSAMAWVYDQQLAGGTGQAGAVAASAGARSPASTDARGSVSTRAGGTAAGGAASASVSSNTSAVAGGVGINARARLSDHALPEHNVKMVFALSTGNYVADVKVSVRDESGRVLIEGVANGPWLYAQLPAGSYAASATFNGQTVTERFTVGRSGQRTAIFRWPASVEQAASGVSPILGTGPQNQPPAVGR